MSSALFAGMLTIFLFNTTSCNQEAMYDKELYKNVVYLLSGSENVYVQSYTLNETESVGYFSICCGGSKPNPEEIVVTLEPDNEIMDTYNKNNFDYESEYAKLLSADRYEIGSYTVTIPANPVDQYVRVPVKVSPLGLSPDTIYFIPLSIKSVSRYEVNPDKSAMLYRVTIENDYAEQSVTTLYTEKGMSTDLSSGTETSMTGTKIVQPLTKDKVRMFAGINSQNQLTTIADIEKLAIVVQVKADNTVEITPYGSIDVKMLSASGYNLYDPKVMQGTTVQRVLYLYYQYRTLDDDGTYSGWTEVKETLTRIEDN